MRIHTGRAGKQLTGLHAAWAAGLILLVLALPARAWDLAGFHADLVIQTNGVVQVTETVTADFTGEQRHGIYRTIPTVYRDKLGNTLKLHWRLVGVTDGQGRPLEAVVQTVGRYRKLRIGSADVNVTGLQTYRIRYEVERAVTFFDDHDELYWNVTGNEWPVQIRQASADVRLALAPGPDRIRALAFTGAYGATTGEARIGTDDRGATFEVDSLLRPMEGLTIVLAWPRGMVTRPGWATVIRWFMADNWPVGLPVYTAGLLFVWWFFQGRDPRGRGTIVVQYEPPGKLSPAEIGTVLDEKVDLRDVSATIIDLAARGFLEIKEIKREGLLRDSVDYQFIRIKDAGTDSSLAPHERKVFRAIFDGDSVACLSSLEGSFYTDLAEIREELYREVVAKGYFLHNPETVRRSYRIVGALITALGIGGGVLAIMGKSGPLWLPWTLAGALSVAASGVVVILFARVLPRKTPRGTHLQEEILGFEEYLTRAEQRELEAAERQNLFERMLPYAMALGVATQWAKRFEKLDLQAPSWYQGDLGAGFQPALFSHRLNHCASAMNRSLAVMPRSSGGSSWSSGGSGFSGGFSGGGGGGGGGGAW